MSRTIRHPNRPRNRGPGAFPWRGSLLPLDRAAGPLRVNQRAASQPGGSKLPRHRSFVLFQCGETMKTLEQAVPIPSGLPVYLKLAMVTMIWGGTFVAGRILSDALAP